MSSVRSPSYPSIPLKGAILRACDLFEIERFNSISREAAAKLLGYSGLTGGSNTLLADLAAYGLIERVGKGEIRVSQRLAQLIHPHDPAEYANALESAAHQPKLFSELRQRFPDHLPSEGNLEGVLVRMGFSSKGTKPAMKSFLETFSYLEEEGVSESHGAGRDEGLDSPQDGGEERPSDPLPERRRKREARPGMKEAVFPLREGDAVLQLPEHLSRASLDTIKKWIDLVLLQLNVEEQEPKQPSGAENDHNDGAA